MHYHQCHRCASSYSNFETRRRISLSLWRTRVLWPTQVRMLWSLSKRALFLWQYDMLVSGERELSQYTLEAEDLKISKLPENNFSTVSSILINYPDLVKTSIRISIPGLCARHAPAPHGVAHHELLRPDLHRPPRRPRHVLLRPRRLFGPNHGQLSASFGHGHHHLEYSGGWEE